MGVSFFPPIAAAIPNADAGQNGLLTSTDFDKLSQLPTGAGVGLAYGITPVISFIAAANDYPLNGLPSFTGKTAIASLSRFVFTARTGTATGTLAYSIGNNSATWDNMFPNTSSIAASVANGTTVPFSSGGASAGGTIDVSSVAPRIKIVTPFTGASVLTGYVLVSIWYVVAP